MRRPHQMKGRPGYVSRRCSLRPLRPTSSRPRCCPVCAGLSTSPSSVRSSGATVVPWKRIFASGALLDSGAADV
eukprot:11189566-Lingulodinium_polyedra.AAC.1